jgi:4-aminobutyrate aminotransferase-like enzyme
MGELFEATRKRGLIIGRGGVTNAFRFTPPLVMQKSHVDEAIQILDASIAEAMETM